MIKKGMKILVTGGSGFLGKHIILKLISAGHSVSALARSPTSVKIVEQLGARAVFGDLEKVENFESSLGQFDVVVHAAAPVEFWGPWDKYQKGIIDATGALAGACSQQQVKKFIYISSESVLQAKKDLLDIDESFAYPDKPNSFYGLSKKITEQNLLKNAGRMEINILRPTFIWGPNCPALSTIAQKVQVNEFMWIDQGRAIFEAVHVENVAHAVTLMITRGKDRHIYFVTDDEITTVRDFFENLFRATQLPLPTKSLPSIVAKPLASMIEFFWNFFNIQKNPPLTLFDLAFVSMSRRYKIQNIQNDVGYRPIMTRAEGFQQLNARSQK